MKKFSDYDSVEVKDFGTYEKLKLGGHIIKILEANVVTTTAKDGTVFEQLNLKYDITEPDEQAGFYQRRFVEKAQKDAIAAKWSGMTRISIPEDNSEDFIKENFKRFITSVEKSNPGYVWNWEEATLSGKIVGCIFGLEEFIASDGRTLTATKPRFFRSTEGVFESPIPKVKLIDKTTMDYEEYIKKDENNKKSMASELEKSALENDDLPF